MPESSMSGSVRGATSNVRPYRDFTPHRIQDPRLARRIDTTPASSTLFSSMHGSAGQ